MKKISLQISKCRFYMKLKSSSLIIIRSWRVMMSIKREQIQTDRY